ncbi:hypothetical protein BTVI_69503 [Pitangus sulphuratus]|nr:hypothetical protein BTVI_69503 [Pitangus sulphuratus]
MDLWSQEPMLEQVSCPSQSYPKRKKHIWIQSLDEVTELVEKGRAIDVIYLGLCRASDTVLHNILVSVLERYEFDTWIRNWLDDYAQEGSVSHGTHVFSTNPIEMSQKHCRNIFKSQVPPSGAKFQFLSYAQSEILCKGTTGG